MFDIIGDVHGHAKGLEQLLKSMDYERKKGLYQHNERIAIFVGDMINRGPESREVLQIIRPMVQSGFAKAILGNHEINLMAFYSFNEMNKPLISHNIRNILQLIPVFESFKNAEAEMHEYIDWLFTLPLYLEFEDIRIVHACWHQESIDFVRNHFPHRKLNHELMIKAMQGRGPEAKALSMLVKGPEVPLPRNRKLIDADSLRRGYIRIKWWDDHKGKTYKQISTQSKIKLPKYQIPANLIQSDIVYPEMAVPVFFGHYSLNGQPVILKPNVCCLDFSVVKTERITAYRWKGESKLIKSHFIQS